MIDDTEALCDFVANVLCPHEDIAHVHITVTLSDGTKKDYMQGDAGSAGIDDRGLIGGPIGSAIGQSMTGSFYCDGEIAESAETPTFEDLFTVVDASDWEIGTFKVDEYKHFTEAGAGVVLDSHVPDADPAGKANLSQDHTGEYIDGEPKR